MVKIVDRLLKLSSVCVCVCGYSSIPRLKYKVRKNFKFHTKKKKYICIHSEKK